MFVAAFDDGSISVVVSSGAHCSFAKGTSLFDSEVRCMHLDVTEGMGTLRTGHEDGRLAVWTIDVETGVIQRVARISVCKRSSACSARFSGVEGVAVAADGSVIAGGGDGSLALVSADHRCTRRTFGAHGGAVTSVATDGRSSLCSGGEDGAVRLWSFDLACDRSLPESPKDAKKGAAIPSTCLQLGADGERLVGGSDDLCLRLWDLSVRKCTRRFLHAADVAKRARDPLGVTSVAFDTEQTRVWCVASGASDGSLLVWDIRQREPLHDLRASTEAVRALSVKGTTVMTGCLDGVAKSWDLRFAGRPLAESWDLCRLRVGGLSALSPRENGTFFLSL